MKKALISDTHFGVRGDNPRFLDYFQKFYSTVFFPYLEENDIKGIIHCGDLADRRKYINIHTAERMEGMFLKEVDKRGLELDMILGNHDCYFKDTNKINSISIINKWGFPIYETATEVMIGDRKVLFVPWICDENRAETMALIEKTDALTAFGHFEFSGFEMYKGIEAHGAFDPSIMSKFDLVGSGHYHTRTKKGNIQYLGAACEYTWSDFDDARGFSVWDSETNELSFVQNPIRMFKKVFYDDSDQKEWDDSFFEEYRDTVVKVVVKNKSEPYLFDQFMERLTKTDLIEYQVVDDHQHKDDEDETDIVAEAQNTVDIFTGYIDQIDTKGLDKNSLKKHMLALFHEAEEVMG